MRATQWGAEAEVNRLIKLSILSCVMRSRASAILFETKINYTTHYKI